MEAGHQTGVFRLEGTPVALAARGHQLAAVWHAGRPSPAGTQVLEYVVFDVAEQRRSSGGALPLSPGATLTW